MEYEVRIHGELIQTIKTSRPISHVVVASQAPMEPFDVWSMHSSEQLARGNMAKVARFVAGTKGAVAIIPVKLIEESTNGNNN